MLCYACVSGTPQLPPVSYQTRKRGQPLDIMRKGLVTRGYWLLVAAKPSNQKIRSAGKQSLYLNSQLSVRQLLRVRLKIIRNARIENVGKYQSCMVSKLRIICKQTVLGLWSGGGQSTQRMVSSRTG